ncbi:glutathione reductase (NADPH) [Monoraphidium neglectum]|uniref:Glutathione reductase (NADPH) n=1 Tax=Monoraphidium neglectum TaxID=145388 RepID=A0A0D2MZP7_9CHLO|nr:glutathione reductase (NADPH) [Monoraphidium neglectum]KIZ07910.1 glutathione reductase (NADPH) [Monoraphidium neglectum]|eukprot:XP_013906929.1 glutathione reductase (NADPH) [Monoraphidium neglectum]
MINNLHSKCHVQARQAGVRRADALLLAPRATAVAAASGGRLLAAQALAASASHARARTFTAQRTAPGRARAVAVAASGDANGSGSYDYDIITIGAGSGGVRGSRFAASYVVVLPGTECRCSSRTSGTGGSSSNSSSCSSSGSSSSSSASTSAKVAVVELPFEFISSDTAGGVGGTCVLRGCVPKKLMVYASEYASYFDDSVGFGWEEREHPAHTWGRFLDAKRKELHRLNGAYKNTLKNANVELIEGRGRIVDAHTIDVDGKKYTAKDIIIAVGGKPQRLPIPGAELAITSDETLELETRPNKVTVLGAGFIALEFGGIFRRFGAETHVCFRAPLPLRGFDDEVRQFATDQYKATGINLHSQVTPKAIVKQPDGRLTVVLEDGEGNTVLMATGRAPKTAGLGLEEAGVKLGKKGEVLVDEYSRTNVPSIWAVGDVTDRINLTPVALMEGMALARTIVKGEPTKPDYDAVPSAVFSWPNIATVGLTEAEAEKRYGAIDVYTSSFRPMRNTVSGSPIRSFMKLVVDAASQRVVGAHMVGDDSAEIMQGFAVAVKVGVTKQQLDSTVGIHPTAAEEFVTMRSVTRQVRPAPVETVAAA